MRLLNEAEALACERSSVVGIGLGLHAGYNAPQRLYAKRGFMPDDRGITCRDRFVQDGAQIVLNRRTSFAFEQAVAPGASEIQ
jgi:hypothetical protein